MAELQAGFGRVPITPDNLGFPMIGYGARDGNADGVQDPLWAKALVLRRGDAAWALCSLDLCVIDAQTVADIRERVSQRTGLGADAILIATTHTHSGPMALDAGNWNRPFAEIAADAIGQAWENLEAARIGHGAGFLYGHALNRRWFDRPVDPAVGVLCVANADGEALGVVINFACHPVVLGYDNLKISADYVGYATAAVEQAIGGVCLFTNGGCADVNPLTSTVRQQMAARRSFTTMARDARYYGEKVDAIPIGDRKGGTFAEAEQIGQALADEVVYVAQGLTTAVPDAAPHSVQAWVHHGVGDGTGLIETQALEIGDFALVAQPGEVFVESALAVKAGLRTRGYCYPWLVSYANDWQTYLTPAAAYPEAGYEVGRAQGKGHSPHLPERLWASICEAMDATML